LAQNLPLNLARIKLIAGFPIAILQVRTVNLDELATAFPGKAKKESNYKRIQRFLRFFELSYALVADLVIKLLVVRHRNFDRLESPTLGGSNPPCFR